MSESTAEQCFAAKCEKPAMAGSVLCREHRDALRAPMQPISDPPDPMIKRLRKLAGNGYEWLHDVADRLEQMQMPHVDVLRIAEVSDSGADTQALMNALCKKVEAQRRQIVRLQGAKA